MRAPSLFIILVSVFLLSCSKSKQAPVVQFDSSGRELKECSIRNGDGRGPYNLIGIMNEKDCKKKISALCLEDRYKQIHKTKGHFARGKFGDRITIGTCP